ncbi:MAG: hypothetical protein AB9891_05700 [Anaerolineaceae bacterium]
MIDEFINATGVGFQQKGYLVESALAIPGLRCLLYTRSPRPQRMAFAKVDDHFLFIDWENDLFGRLDLLLEAHKKFSAFVNRSYRVPHAWRMTMPNLVTAAVSIAEFPTEALDYVRSRYLNHWAGGETGQLMLVKLPERRMEYHPEPYRMSRQTGSIPLLNAVNLMKEIIGGEQ